MERFGKKLLSKRCLVNEFINSSTVVETYRLWCLPCWNLKSPLIPTQHQQSTSQNFRLWSLPFRGKIHFPKLAPPVRYGGTIIVWFVQPFFYHFRMVRWTVQSEGRYAKQEHSGKKEAASEMCMFMFANTPTAAVWRNLGNAYHHFSIYFYALLRFHFGGCRCDVLDGFLSINDIANLKRICSLSVFLSLLLCFLAVEAMAVM